MNFGFTEEQELLRKTARDFLGESAPDDPRPRGHGERREPFHISAASTRSACCLVKTAAP